MDTLVHYTPGRLFESLAQVCGTGPLMEMMKEATETLKHVHEQQRLLGLNQSTLAQEVSRVEQHLETIQQWQMVRFLFSFSLHIVVFNFYSWKEKKND